MATVRLEGIKRRFNNVTAIEDISFNVPDGQFWVLVGPSGCGKSTILRMIAGLETATDGKLYIGGVLVNGVPARQRDVAMVFQNYALYPHMTVRENIAFGLQMRRVDSKMIRDRVETVARSLSLDHLLDRKPKQLSGGQQQRVALGRAIARQPQVFLLDEPLSNLDAQLRDDTRAELKQLHHQLGITTIYVTHDQVEAMTLADQIVVLERGRIQQIGDPQTIYARPTNRMVATFLGHPPMNILPVIYTGTSFALGDQFLPAPVELRDKLLAAEGQGFDLGIRPEHVEIFEPQRSQSRGGVPELFVREGFRRQSPLTVGNPPAELAPPQATGVPLEEGARCGAPRCSDSHGTGMRGEHREEEMAQLVVEVKVVEPLGRETLIRACLLGSSIQLSVQAAPDVRPHVGDRLSLQLDLEQLFVFDSATGKTLYP